MFWNRSPNLYLREWKRDGTNVVEEYYWAMTQAAIAVSRKYFDWRQTFWRVTIALSRGVFELRDTGVVFTLLLPQFGLNL